MPFRAIHILSVLTLMSLVVTGCGDPYVEPLPPRDRIHFPIGLAVHPNGRYLYAVNSNFDTRYREDVGGTVSVIDLETREILANQSTFIPSFGGSIQLNEDASRAYVATRQSNAIVSLKLSERGDSIFCDRTDSGAPTVSSDPDPCALRRVPDVEGANVVPSDPFDIDVATLDIGDTRLDLINVAHLRGDDVTAITVPYTDGQPDLGSASMRSAALTDAANVTVRRPGTQDIYVGDRNGGEIIVYFPYIAPNESEVQAIIVRDAIILNREADAVDIRGLVFSEDGETLYAVSRAPDALHVIDLGPSNLETGGGTLNAVVDTIPLPRRPADISLHNGLLYIPSFSAELVSVVNPLTRTTIDEIEIGAPPYKFIVNDGPNKCAAGQPCEAYVSLFNDSPETNESCAQDRTLQCGSIGIINLDPNDARYHTLTGKIF